MIRYRVDRRFSGKKMMYLYAVMREGKRGGERVVTVYGDANTAELMCMQLNAKAEREI